MEAHKCPDFDYGEVKPGTPEMQNFCLCTPISAEQRMLGMNTCRVHCSVCEGQDHHWMPDCDEDNGQPYMACKHCDARREYQDDDE
jgi:hypothetical protein